MGTVTHLPVRTPQPAPDETGEFSLLALMYETGIAEGRRQRDAELGIPQSSPVRSRRLVLSSPGTS